MNEGGNSTQPTGGLVPSDEEILEPPPKESKPKVIYPDAATNLEDINGSEHQPGASLIDRPPNQEDGDESGTFCWCFPIKCGIYSISIMYLLLCC